MSNASLRKQKKSEKVPELQPPGVLGSKIHSAENPKCIKLPRPGLHPQELFEDGRRDAHDTQQTPPLQARLVLHDLATSGLGQKVSQLGGKMTRSWA